MMFGFGAYGVPQLLGGSLADLVKAVHVRSNYGPDIDLVDPFGPAAPSPFMAALQPQIIIDTDAGPVQIAPYGAPGPTQWSNFLQTGGLLGFVVFALAGYGAWKLWR